MSEYEDYTTNRIKAMEHINKLMFDYHYDCLGKDATPEQIEAQKIKRLKIEEIILSYNIDEWNRIVVRDEVKSRG